MTITLEKPDFQAIPQFTRGATYEVDVSWGHLLRHLEEHVTEMHLDIDPDFQRGHVWTLEQQIAYVEFCLRGGAASNRLLFNCPGWKVGRIKDYVLVDGKQRLTAVVGFLKNEVPAFGYHYSEFTGTLRLHNPRFKWCVNDLGTRAEVLQWYLELNTGGTVHTEAEIAKVKRMLEKC
jgi:hypothetical protein